MIRGVKTLAEVVGFELLTAVVRAVPRGVAMKCANAVGKFAFDVLRLRRAVAVRNVQERLELNSRPDEVIRIARESYAVIARTFVDLIRLDLVGESVWDLVAKESFEGLAEHEGPTIFVSGHVGNWEIMGLAIRHAGVPLHAIARDQRNEHVNRAVKRVRAAASVPMISSRAGMREAFRVLMRGESIATLMDQDARHRGVFVDFLGTPTATHTGIVSLAMRTGARLVPGACLDRRGALRFELGEAWTPDPSLPEEENLRRGAQHFTRFLEEIVRENPENYLWAHRRWKTRPPEQVDTS